jgi:hypothetical protein
VLKHKGTIFSALELYRYFFKRFLRSYGHTFVHDEDLKDVINWDELWTNCRREKVQEIARVLEALIRHALLIALTLHIGTALHQLWHWYRELPHIFSPLLYRWSDHLCHDLCQCIYLLLYLLLNAPCWPLPQLQPLNNLEFELLYILLTHLIIYVAPYRKETVDLVETITLQDDPNISPSLIDQESFHFLLHLYCLIELNAG